MIPGARWRDPAAVDRWAGELPADREVRRLLRLRPRGQPRHRDAAARGGAEGALPARRHRRLAGGGPAARSARPGRRRDARRPAPASRCSTPATAPRATAPTRRRAASPRCSTRFAAAGVRRRACRLPRRLRRRGARRSCARVHAVLVWCNPIEGGRRRDRLDALLREVAPRRRVRQRASRRRSLRLGTKDVLVDDPRPAVRQRRAPHRQPGPARGRPAGAPAARARACSSSTAATAASASGASSAVRQRRARRCCMRHAQRGSDDATHRPGRRCRPRWRRTSSRRAAAT